MQQFISYYDQFLNILTKLAAVIAGLFILATAFIILYEVIMRSIFNAPTEWVLEISTYFIIMAGFLGLAITFREQAHVHVDILTNRFNTENRRKLRLILNILSFLLFLIFMTESMDLVIASYTYNKLSPSILRFPLFIPQLALVLGSALLLGEIARQFFFDLWRLNPADKAYHTKGRKVSGL